MTWRNIDIEKIQYDFLHDAIYSINRIVPGFSHVYMDGEGELALMFNGELTEEQIKGIRFELRPFGPYDAAPVGPSAEELVYGRTHVYRDREDGSVQTEVYSPDGINYRMLD